ncbi:hypothetical protein [Kitasatospora sp. NPDC050463]|uniref:hypothetical protein n=1 Tax=Kitasatospora sp. NPDC050463 TaxID=3155786 RepID=UPI0033F87606
MERILLLIIAHGAQSSLLYQAMERPELRWAMRDPQHGTEYVQMLIRMGYGPAGPATTAGLRLRSWKSATHSALTIIVGSRPG